MCVRGEGDGRGCSAPGVPEAEGGRGALPGCSVDLGWFFFQRETIELAGRCRSDFWSRLWLG